MGIGERIKLWLTWLMPWTWVRNYASSVRIRRAQIQPNLSQTILIYRSRGDFSGSLEALINGLVYIYLGVGTSVVSAAGETLEWAAGAPLGLVKIASDALSTSLKAAASSPMAKAIAELVGTVVTEPVVSLLESYAGREMTDKNTMDMAKAFHGIASGLPWASETIDSVLKAKFGERAPSVGKNIMALYWGLGLGFLGWQTLAPLLTSGLQPTLERHYNRKFTPARFTPAQLSDLYGLGMRSQSDITAALKDLGWRDQDIGPWVKLGYRTLTESALWDLYHKGIINKTVMDSRLRGLGYDPSDIPWVYKANEKDEVKESTTALYSVAKQAFKERLIGEAEFRQILTSLKHTAREIDLQVQLIKADWVVETRRLTTGQIKELYNQRILGKTETLKRLVDQAYLQDDAERLIMAWDIESVPKASRINRGTILEGYTAGVLSKSEATDLLRAECGYDATKASLIIKIEEATAPKKPILGPQGAAPATLSMFAQWATAGLITRQQVLARPEMQRYAAEDRARIVAQMFLVEPVAAPQLPASLVLDAYVHGVVDREFVTNWLTLHNYAAFDVELMIRTAEANNPQVFGPPVIEPPKALSLSVLADFAAAGLITRAEYEQRPELSKYAAFDRARLADLAFAEAVAAPVELSDSLLVDAFVYEVISEQEMVERMLGRGLAAADVALALETIKLQHPAVFGVTPRELLKQPTVGSVQLAYQRGLIDEAGFSGRLGSMGYTEDAVLMFKLNAEYQAPAVAKQLTQSQILSLYDDSLIGRSEAQRRLVELGYTISDVELLIRQKHPDVADTEAAAMFEAGLLDATGFAAIVTDLGFTPNQIAAYLEQFVE